MFHSAKARIFEKTNLMESNVNERMNSVVNITAVTEIVDMYSSYVYNELLLRSNTRIAYTCMESFLFCFTKSEYCKIKIAPFEKSMNRAFKLVLLNKFGASFYMFPQFCY